MPKPFGLARRGSSDGAILALGDRQTVTAAYAARLLGLPYNSPESVENCRSKLRQREVLARRGLARSGFFLLLAGASRSTRCCAACTFPCVVKPLRLAASQGVIRANNRGEFIAAVERIARLLSSAELQVTREARSRSPARGALYSRSRSCRSKACSKPAACESWRLFDKPDPLEGPYFEESIYVTPSRLPAARAGADRRLRGANRCGRWA